MVDMEETVEAGNPIGERLRVAREAKGLSLDDVASQTRIPIRHLKHIEQGDWSALPAITYSVGFARTYANAVGLNGNEVGAELREHLGAQRQESVAAVYYEPADPARVPPKSLAIIAVVIAVLLIGAYIVWRSGTLDGTGVDESQLSGVETAAPAPQQAAPPAQTAPAPAPTGPVVLTAIEEVWLRIYEADGKRIHEATMQPGDRFEVPATATRPQILTGKPQALRVTVGNTEVAPLGEPERTISDVSLLAADLLARPAANQPAQPQGQAAPGGGAAIPPAGPQGF
jgi:cytoskeleton protein RodZ